MLEQQAFCLLSHRSTHKILAFLLPPAPLHYWTRGGDPTLTVLPQVAHPEVYTFKRQYKFRGSKHKARGGTDNEGPCMTYSSYASSVIKCKPRSPDPCYQCVQALGIWRHCQQHSYFMATCPFAFDILVLKCLSALTLAIEKSMAIKCTSAL